MFSDNCFNKWAIKFDYTHPSKNSRDDFSQKTWKF